jgi:hypothetical protein
MAEMAWLWFPGEEEPEPEPPEPNIYRPPWLYERHGKEKRVLNQN